LTAGGPSLLAFCALTAIAMVFLCTPTVAAAAQQFPVMGCNARGAISGPVRAYAPTVCELSSVPPQRSGEETLASITHVHWSHWGAKTAAGAGFLVQCGTGCAEVHVTLSIYDLQPDPSGSGSAYSRLTVSWRRQVPISVTPGEPPITSAVPGGTHVFDVLPAQPYNYSG
jgi:hypothetical protein